MARLAAALAGLVLGGFAAPVLSQTVAPACDPALTVTESAKGGIDVSVSLPCQPYAKVILRYGPLRIGEELSQDGALDLTLPRLPGVEDVSAEAGAARMRTPLPATNSPELGFVAVIWTDGPRWGELNAQSGELAWSQQALGFPGQTDPAPLDLMAIDPGAPEPVALVLPISPDTCGRPLGATVISSYAPTVRAMSLTAPPCALVGQSLHIPLS